VYAPYQGWLIGFVTDNRNNFGVNAMVRRLLDYGGTKVVPVEPTQSALLLCSLLCRYSVHQMFTVRTTKLQLANTIVSGL
jgi:hypothetical protein